VAFGGPDRKTLYVTAGKTLYRFPVNVSGHAAYPPLDRKQRTTSILWTT
jgi:gluconolactonase